MTRFASAVRTSFPTFVAEFDEIEAEEPRWAQRFRDAQVSVKQGFGRAKQRRQNNVEFLVGIRLVGLATRVKQLADAVVSLVNKDNPHAAAPVARALFEACCIPIYLRRELVPRVKKGRTNDVHMIVFKLGLGGSGSLGGGHIKPINVKSLIGSARAELKAIEAGVPESERQDVHQLIEMYYGPLTELSHPNWAALNLGTKLGMPPKFSSPVSFDDAVMHAVVSSSAYVLVAGGRAFDELVTTLGDIPLDLPAGDPDWPDDGGLLNRPHP